MHVSAGSTCAGGGKGVAEWTPVGATSALLHCGALTEARHSARRCACLQRGMARRARAFARLRYLSLASRRPAPLLLLAGDLAWSGGRSRAAALCSGEAGAIGVRVPGWGRQQLAGCRRQQLLVDCKLRYGVAPRGTGGAAARAWPLPPFRAGPCTSCVTGRYKAVGGARDSRAAVSRRVNTAGTRLSLTFSSVRGVLNSAVCPEWAHTRRVAPQWMCLDMLVFARGGFRPELIFF